MRTTAFLQNLSGWEWVVILLVVLLLFGATKIPKLMRGVGQGIREFKSGLRDEPKEARVKPDGRREAHAQDAP